MAADASGALVAALTDRLAETEALASALRAQLEAREAELAEARLAAEAASSAKAEFLTIMSHELRTPLNAIAGYAQLLEMGFRGPLTEGQRDAVMRILRGQEQLLALVDAVLTFGRLTSGRLEVEPAEITGNDLMELASAPHRDAFPRAGVDFRLQGTGAPILVAADRDHAVEVLRHLLGNALKFTERGGWVSLSCRAEDGEAVFTVADCGRGIAPSQQEAIFRPFVQVEKGLTRTADGSGLGLAVGRELAERMGGSLGVQSELGVGSRFELRLPLAARPAGAGATRIDTPGQAP